MRNIHEGQVISFEEARQRIMEKRDSQRLSEILQERLPIGFIEMPVERRVKGVGVIDLFIPPHAR